MRVPRTASRQAAESSSGSPSLRAKSFAVPAGTTASGNPAWPAAAATGAMLPSPPATTTRSAPDSTAAATSSMPNRLTSAPNDASRSAHSAGSLAPERSFATSATRVTTRADPACVFLDAFDPAMLLAPMGAQARVFVTRKLPGDALDRLRAEHDVEVWPERLPPPREELMARAPEVEGLLSLLTDPVDAELIQAAPRLRAISNYAVGVDNVDVEAAAARGIPVGNTPDVLTESTADLALALMLGIARRLAEGEAFVKAGEWATWEPDLMLGRDLHGATVGIVGHGRIGQAVGRRLEGFGCEVLTNTRTGGVSLEELLERADFVTLHCPLTPDTRGLIDAGALRRMKPTAYLVNTARGPVVDTEALAAALAAGELAGAALDVTDPEPLPGDHPLLAAPNLLVVPHIASATHATRGRMADIAVDNLLAGLAGEPMPHSVTPRAP